MEENPKNTPGVWCVFFSLHSLKLTAKAPENRPSQKEIHLPTIDFQGQTVSFREGNVFSFVFLKRGLRFLVHPAC